MNLKFETNVINLLLHAHPFPDLSFFLGPFSHILFFFSLFSTLFHSFHFFSPFFSLSVFLPSPFIILLSWPLFTFHTTEVNTKRNSHIDLQIHVSSTLDNPVTLMNWPWPQDEYIPSAYCWLYLPALVLLPKDIFILESRRTSRDSVTAVCCSRASADVLVTSDVCDAAAGTWVIPLICRQRVLSSVSTTRRGRSYCALSTVWLTGRRRALFMRSYSLTTTATSVCDHIPVQCL